MAESSVNVPNTGTAPVRVLQVTTLIGGVPTTVDMQVIAIADSNGLPIDAFTDSQWQADVLRELRAIHTLLSALSPAFA